MNFPTHIVAVGGFVTNEKDEVLLVKSECRGWEFPGGQVEVGESLPQAIKREVFEESGAIVEVEGIIGIYSNTSKKQGYNGVEEIPTIVNIDFRCRYISGELRLSNETIDFGWFTREQAQQMITFPKFIFRFKNMLDKNGQFHCDAFKQSGDFLGDFEFIEQYVF